MERIKYQDHKWVMSSVTPVCEGSWQNALIFSQAGMFDGPQIRQHVKEPNLIKSMTAVESEFTSFGHE